MSRTIALRSVVAVLLVLGWVPIDAGSSVAAERPDSIGVVDPSTGIWYLRSPDGATTAFYFGNPGDSPLTGDWDCDGIDTPGLHRAADGYVYLRNDNSQGPADVAFFFGDPGDIALAGDFDGDGCDTVSLYRPSEQRIYIINRLGADGAGLGPADHSFVFGDPGDMPFAADLDGDGSDEVGLHRPSTGLVYTPQAAPGTPSRSFIFGDPEDVVLAGDWDGDDTDSVGVWRPSTATFHLRQSNSAGPADVSIGYGNSGLLPVRGDFGSLPGADEPPPRGTLLDVVTREAWGAAPARSSELVEHVISLMTVHHAGDQATTTGPERYRAWQAWHMEGKGWPDLAYHFIVGIDGTVYEGRDPKFETDTFTGYDTTGHLQIVVEGNFDEDQPTPAQLDSLVQLLAWGSRTYGVDPSMIAGHADHASTSCPGRNLHEWLASGVVERRVREVLQSGGVELHFTGS